MLTKQRELQSVVPSVLMLFVFEMFDDVDICAFVVSIDVFEKLHRSEEFVYEFERVVN